MINNLKTAIKPNKNIKQTGGNAWAIYVLQWPGLLITAVMPKKTHVTNTERIWLSVSILVALIGLVVATISYFFGVKVISTGEAYGFQIGDSREKTYKNAQKLLEQKEIVAIHTWPKDQFHRPFETTENPDKNTDPRWVMVVNPDWWNNTITVTFENNAAIEIRRDKIYSELP